MGTKPVDATVAMELSAASFKRWEGTGSRGNHEPEDLLEEMTVVLSRLGNG